MDQQQGPSPILFFDTLTAYQRTEVLRGAIELDLFTAIGEGNSDVASIAQRCKASERGIRSLADYLTACGFLSKTGDNYELTRDSEVFLNGHSPAYMGSAIGFMLSPMLRDSFSDIAGTVRKGGTLLPDQGSVSHQNPEWVTFARGMGPLTAMPAEMMAKKILNGSQEKMKVLDLAAGHGLFGIAFAKQNPNAEIYALDWPNVLEVAKENAQIAGIEARFHTLPGSAFEVDPGDGFDVVLFTNFFHHFDQATCETLMRKFHGVLRDGGTAVTLEFIPEEDRITPPHAAMFCMVMLASTPKGDVYTFNEYQKMFSNAGYSSTELHEFPPTPQRVLISRK